MPVRHRLRRLVRLGAGGLVLGALATALTSCFSAPPQIVSLEPNRGSTSVAADAPVRVVFDRPVARASMVGRFSVNPSISGCNLATVFSAPSGAPCWIHWLDPQPGFELVHQGAVFAPATSYTFTLAGGFGDPEGDRNDLDHHWVLTTASAPAVSSTTPGDRTADVAVDARLAVSFSAPMDAPSTAAAIVLSPAVAGTRVVRNSADHSRFVILPGQLLTPNTAYTVSVDGSARGEDEQFLGAALTVHFSTGARVENPHAVVLAGRQGESSTEVVIPDLSPAASGDPIAAPVLLRAPRCTVSTGCGAVHAAGALQTYAAAAVAPDGVHVAVVVDDALTSSSLLKVFDIVTSAEIADIPDGARPSWSPDGSELALAADSSVEVLDVRSQIVTRVAADTTVVAPPLWAGSTTLVLTTATAAGTPATVELVNRQLDARYALPSAPPGSVAAAVSPGGSRLALSVASGGVVVLPAPSAPGTAQTLTGQLEALGFAGEGSLLAVSTTGEDTSLVRISVVGGDTTTVPLGAGLADVRSVRVALDGRRLVFLATDSAGVEQAAVAAADGSGELAMTRFPVGGLEAQSVAFAN